MIIVKLQEFKKNTQNIYQIGFLQINNNKSDIEIKFPICSF